MTGIMQSTLGNWKASSAAAAAALIFDLDGATYTGLSAQFSGSNSLSVPNSAALNPGTGDFTIEFWTYLTSTTNNASFYRGNNNGVDIFMNGSGRLAMGQAQVSTLITDSVTMTTGAWVHVAAVRISGTTRLYKNGVLVGSAGDVRDYVTDSVNYIGTQGGIRITGYMSNVRVVIGLGVYTGAFTPPTSPLTVTQSAGTNISAITTQTQLLLPLTTTPFTDISTNAITVTNTGSVNSSLISPFTTTDATGTYALSITNAGSISMSLQQTSGSAQFTSANITNLSATVTAPSTDSITYEWWFKADTTTGQAGMLQTRTSTSGADGIDVFINDGAIGVSTSGIFLLSGGTVVANTWYHIALVRNGTTAFTVYLNGTSIGTFNKTGLTGTQLYLGIKSAGSSAEAFDGYITDFRYVKGTAVYTAAFTPPTAPPTAISGTNLLLLINSSGTLLTDSSGNNRTVTNNNGVAYSAVNPWAGYFSKSNNVGTDVIYGGPDYVTGQSYTVFMAYQLSSVSAGRLLNTQSEASKDWLMGAYNGNPNTFYPNFSVNLPGSGADTVWHFGWATWNTSTSVGQLYTATSAQPTGVAFTATNAGGGGFNQLRMFSRAAGSEVQSGNIAFIKVYNGVLDLATIQSQYATYKARFGY